MSEINLTSIYLSNLIGTALSFTMILGNHWRFKEKDKENQIIVTMIIITLISCIADPIACTFDGKSGILSRVIIYGTNTWIYLADIVGSALWILFMEHHIRGYFDRKHVRFLSTIIIISSLALIINLFIPIVFTVDANNVYSRMGLGIYYGIVTMILVVDCIILYCILKTRGGNLTFFPIFTYSIPLTLGIVIQTMNYGISLAWPCAAISLVGVLISLQNEMIFRDKLTGLFNRYYLDKIKERLKNSKNSIYAVMMIDLNDFKSINDKYGHVVGDKALVETSELLVRNVGEAGTVIRYAGDEFVIVFNASDKIEALAKVSSLQEKFDEFNAASGNEYELSVSIGCGVFDLNKKTIEDVLSVVDAYMYTDKEQFYLLHPDKKRRAVI